MDERSAGAGAAEINDGAFVSVADLLHGAAEDLATGLGDIAEHVAEEILGVHADEDGIGDFLFANAATDEGDVGHGIDG